MPLRDFNSQVNLHSASNMLLLKEKFQILNLRFLGLTLLVFLVLWLIFLVLNKADFENSALDHCTFLVYTPAFWAISSIPKISTTHLHTETNVCVLPNFLWVQEACIQLPIWHQLFPTSFSGFRSQVKFYLLSVAYVTIIYASFLWYFLF